MAEKGDLKSIVLVGYIYEKRERDDSGCLEHIRNEDKRLKMTIPAQESAASPVPKKDKSLLEESTSNRSTSS